MIVPVAVTVAATAAQNTDGSLSSALNFGGTDVANAQSTSLYNNGSIFGANDWTWRQESGDWRFFYYNVAEPGARRDALPVRHDVGRPDGHRPRHAAVRADGPAVRRVVPLRARCVQLDRHGRRQRQRLSRAAARGRFNTSTGHNEEVVAAPASQGVHAVVQHGVGFNGDKFNVPFSTTRRCAVGEPVGRHLDRGGRRHRLVRRHRQVEPRDLPRPQGRRVRAQPAAGVHRARGTGRPVRGRPVAPRAPR